MIDETTICDLAGFESDPTEWFVVTQQQIDEFAHCTHDDQFIHVDPVRARKTPYGTTIAHGFLTLSMLSYFASQYSPEVANVDRLVNYGCDKVRFLQPVKVGSRIRARSKVLSVEEKKPKAYLLRSSVLIEIEGEERPALACETLGLVYFS